MPTKKLDLERNLLMLLSQSNLRMDSFSNISFLHNTYVASRFIDGDNLEQVLQILWSLISRGLVWLRPSQNAAATWGVHLTDRGRQVALTDDPNPDVPSEYMSRLARTAPNTSSVVKMYLEEAVNSYAERLYLSSMVMLGVAAEACTMETAACYVAWAGARANSSKEIFESTKMYSRKLNEFQKRLDAEKEMLPANIKETLHIDMLGLMELIRLTRNDAGHPTGVKFERDDCNIRLQVYAVVHKKLYQLQDFFAQGTK